MNSTELLQQFRKELELELRKELEEKIRQEIKAEYEAELNYYKNLPRVEAIPLNKPVEQNEKNEDEDVKYEEFFQTTVENVEDCFYKNLNEFYKDLKYKINQRGKNKSFMVDLTRLLEDLLNNNWGVADHGLNGRDYTILRGFFTRLYEIYNIKNDVYSNKNNTNHIDYRDQEFSIMMIDTVDCSYYGYGNGKSGRGKCKNK